GTEEVRAFLRHLVNSRRAPSTCGVYAAALRFLYDVTLDRPAVAARIPRRRVPERLPTILSTAEVERLLAAVHAPKHRAILMTAYGTGLRVSEIVALQTTDIDAERLLIRVRAGKGGRDRDVPLSARLDRKSTRLNSSHVSISYAVFCLKKKKKKTKSKQ